MPIEITDVIVKDIRFPTAAAKDGSDALNAGDYSATYVVLRTSDPTGPEGHGITFTNGRVLEYVDHLHEHFVDPVRVRGGRYLVPTAPGYSITMKPQSLNRYEYPSGAAWKEATG